MVSMQQKASSSEKCGLVQVPPLLLLTSALTTVKRESEASAGRRDLKRAVLSAGEFCLSPDLISAHLIACDNPAFSPSWFF